MKSDRNVWDSLRIRWICLGILSGAGIGGIAVQDGTRAVTALCAIAALSVVRYPRFARTFLPVVILMACFTVLTVHERTAVKIDDRPQRISGSIVRVEQRPDDTRLTIALDHSSWQRRYAWTYVPTTLRLSAGDTIALTCVRRVAASVSEDLKWIAAAQRIAYLCLSANEVDVRSTRSLRHSLAQVSEWYARSLRRAVPGAEGALLESMVLNRTGFFPRQLRNAFSVTGVAHIISVSGIHFGVLVVALDQLLAVLGLRPKGRLVAATVIMGMYLILIHYPVAAVRAAFMSGAVLFARVTGRTIQGFHLLLVTAAGYVLYNPMSVVYDISFQLSFLAMAALLFVSLVGSRRGYLMTSLLSGGIASLMTAPIVAVYFSVVSIGGVAINLLVVPLSGPLLILALLVPPFQSIPIVGTLSSSALLVVTKLTTKIVTDAATIPGMFIAIPSVPWFVVLVYYVIMVWVAWMIIRRQYVFR